MSPNEFLELVFNLSYKPKTTISARLLHDRDAIEIEIRRKVPNSKSPFRVNRRLEPYNSFSSTNSDWHNQEIDVVLHKDISLFRLNHLNKQLALQFLLGICLEFEKHEAMEFLKYNNEHVLNPH